MKPEDIRYMKEQILEHCSVEELMKEDYILELVKLHRTLTEILTLVKIPKGIGAKEYYKLREEKRRYREAKEDE